MTNYLSEVLPQIYIECNPTGADGEVLVPQGNQPSNQNMNLGDKVKSILSSPWIAALFGVILLYLIIVGFDAIADKIFNPGKQNGGNTTSHLSGGHMY